MPPWAFSALKVPVIAACLYGAYVTGKWGLADYYADQSYQAMLAWTGRGVSDDDWQAAYQPLVTALGLDPGHPTYNHRMGRLCHIRMIQDPLQRDAWAEKALAHLRASLEVRATWPMAWANLAWVKKDVAQYDSEFLEALVKASTYGPWEPAVHDSGNCTAAGGDGRRPLRYG